jgi:ribonuclease G
MTRQNVTDGPREVMTRKCPTCGGDGIVYSEASAAIDVERRLRALAAGSRAQAFRVELADSIASALVGPGARRLLEFEALTKKRFFLEGKPETHLDHFVVLSEGKLADLAPPAPVGEDAEVTLHLVEVDRYDGAAAVGKLDGLDIVVADAASQVGKRIKVRVERVLDGRAYAVAIRKTKAAPEPLTAEGEAEKPTRKPPARKGAAVAKESEPAAVEEPVVAEEPEAKTADAAAEVLDEPGRASPASPATLAADSEEAPKPKKKTRRGSRGGRKRKKAPATAETAETEAGDASEEEPESARGVTIHVPGEELGRDGKAEPAEEAPAEPEPEVTEEPTTAEAVQETAEVLAESGQAEAEAPKPKKKTRRGSRGGKNRKKKPTAAAQNGAEAVADTSAAPESEPVSENGDFDYVPMAEWADELESKG